MEIAKKGAASFVRCVVAGARGVWFDRVSLFGYAPSIGSVSDGLA